jgi:hypothetical protein
MEITCISVAHYQHGLHSNIMNIVNVQIMEHTHLSVVPKVKKGWNYTLIPLYILLVWHLIKH